MKRLAAVFLLTVLNSAYLYARADATLFYFASVALHVALGLALSGLAARSLRTLWPSAGAVLRGGVALLALGAVFGITMLVTGATRPYRWILYTHIALAAAGSLLVLAAVLRSALGQSDRVAAFAVGLGLAAILASAAAARWTDQQTARRFRIVNPASAPLSMEQEGQGKGSPFFPSSARTNVGGIIPANFFLTSKHCARCHQDIYDQWNSSAHHFSSFNNQWYRKSIEYMQDVVGTQPSKWCAGCHDHAVFFNGRFDRPIKEQIETPEAQAGLACTSCHSIVHVGSTMGQGDFQIEYPPLHDLAVSENPFLAWSHDYLLKLDPRPHRETFIKSFHRLQTPEFCSSCHKVHLDVPVNKYRWFRGFNDYDNWQASGMSGEGARSFYYPPKPQKCADCHMPLVASNDPAAKDGKVRSHRFPAANTALPFVNNDHEQLKITQDFLRDGVVSVDVFGLVRGAPGPEAGAGRKVAGNEPRLASTFAQGEEAGSLGATQAFLTAPAEVLGPLDKVDLKVRRGESVRVEVVVRTRKIGHFFPGGTVDAFDVWVELVATDDKGRTIFHSGAIEDGGKGPVEPGAHMYRSLQLDEHGNPINKRNAWMSRSVARAPHPAGRGRHHPLPPVGPRGRGRPHHAQGAGELPQVRLVEHAVGLAGVRDPEQKDFSLTPARRRPLALQRRYLEGLRPGEGHPADPGHRHGPGHGPLGVIGKADARRRRSRCSTSRCASAGTTTASACCSGATSRRPRPPSRRSPGWSPSTRTAG